MLLSLSIVNFMCAAIMYCLIRTRKRNKCKVGWGWWIFGFNCFVGIFCLISFIVEQVRVG